MKHDICLKKNLGFTLIELLTVFAIVGILAVIAIPQFLNYRTSAFNATAQSDLKNIKSHFESYYIENSRYPDDL